jgi:hypothetical protein
MRAARPPPCRGRDAAGEGAGGAREQSPSHPPRGGEMLAGRRVAFPGAAESTGGCRRTAPRPCGNWRACGRPAPRRWAHAGVSRARRSIRAVLNRGARAPLGRSRPRRGRKTLAGGAPCRRAPGRIPGRGGQAWAIARDRAASSRASPLDSLRRGIPEPPLMQAPVQAVPGQQVFVAPALDNAAPLDDTDQIRMADRAEPVRDHQRGAPGE